MRRRSLFVFAMLAVVAAGLLGCAHAIGPNLPTPGAPKYDFRQPPCAPAPAPGDLTPDDRVVVRYLGAGGLYVGWRGAALLTGPFFSNPGLWRTGLGKIRMRQAAIRQGLAGIPRERVGAILAGHSHYDHIGDLPVVAGSYLPQARLYLNQSGVNALAPYPDLLRRTTRLEGLEDQAGLLSDAAGRPLPFRVRAVRSGHAPHAGPITLWSGTTEVCREPWETRRNGSLKAGQPYALVIDLLASAQEGAAVEFRIYYQDAAAMEPLGIPPKTAASAGGAPEPPYDLAVVCMASAHLVEPYPEQLLHGIRPRHVLIGHYENFFRPWGPGHGFVPLLTRGRANRFLQRVSASLGAPTAGPVGAVCGPSCEQWTMPLVGEWLQFRPSNANGRYGEE
jgi:hypothetical protein